MELLTADIRIDHYGVQDTLADDVRWTAPAAQGAAAQVLLRRARIAPVRSHHQLPEYYPSRCERLILNRHAPSSSTAARSRGARVGHRVEDAALLYAMAGAGSLRRYVPFDVDESVVEACAIELVELYPGLCVHGVVGDFGRDLEHVPDGRRLFAFLGGTIGPARGGVPFPDARPDGRRRPAVIGTDLVKDRAVLEAAYNDSAGVTADFNRNVLRVVNDGLDADFEPEAFEHVAFFDEANSWVEMRLRANGAQTVRLDGANLEVRFADGEEIRTEISAKFTRDAVERELRAAGLRLDDFFSDGAGLFGLAFARLAVDSAAVSLSAP